MPTVVKYAPLNPWSLNLINKHVLPTDEFPMVNTLSLVGDVLVGSLKAAMLADDE